MKKYAILILLSIWSKVFAADNTVSLIIPCSHHHAHHLHSLLKLYERQTVLPTEAIISLSEANQVDPSVIIALQTEPWLFPLTLLLSDEQYYAGTNRNIACAQAKGTILVLQDADDIPHPQRIEIIKYFFDTHAVDHLMHLFTFSHTFKNESPHFTVLNLRETAFVYRTNFYEPVSKKYCIHNGNIAITQQVFSSIKWFDCPRGQDTYFDKKAYKLFKHNLVIKEALCVYRQELSSLEAINPDSDTEYWQRIYDQFYAHYSLKSCS